MNKSLKRRLWALVLVFAMLIPTIPFVGTYVSAADPSGELSVIDLSVTYEKKAGNASTCNLDGTTITATAQSKSGMGSNNKVAGETEIIITYTGSSKAILSFSYSGTSVNSMKIDDVDANIESDTFSKPLEKGATVKIVFTSESGTLSNKKTAALFIKDVALSVEKNVNVTFKTVYNGSYTVDNNPLTSNTTKINALNSRLLLIQNNKIITAENITEATIPIIIEVEKFLISPLF